MLKNHFFIAYAGNKRQEVDKIFDTFKSTIDSINIIVEPFCGSSALSFYISTLYPGRFQYVLNDNNKYLIEIYQILQDENKTEDFLNCIKEEVDKIKSKELYLQHAKNTNDSLISWFIVNTYYTIRPGLYPLEGLRSEKIDKMKKAPIIEFLRNENIIMSCSNWSDVYDQYRSNEDALIFLDPPYLSSCNDFYKCPDVNIYEYLFDNDIDKEKSKIVLCLENIWIIKLLFKNKKFIEYIKKYETSKKKTTHAVILNNNIL